MYATEKSVGKVTPITGALLQVFPQIEQGTEEWLAARCGVTTASRMKDVMAKGRGGKPSATREQYLVELAIERLTGKPYPNGYTNSAMQHGTETEPMARDAYAAASGHWVDEVGFCRRGDIGCSPDGLIGDDGGLEIKCPYNPARHLDARVRMPPEHTFQVQGSMLVTGRQWWDFVSYDPRMPPHLQLFIHRIERDENLLGELTNNLEKFQAELQKMVEELSNA